MYEPFSVNALGKVGENLILWLKKSVKILLNLRHLSKLSIFLLFRAFIQIILK